MRFLCLHGVGSSASICESQLGPFFKAVDPSYEFIFVDGPVPSASGPGMGTRFDGPFYSHTTGYAPYQIAEALEHLDATIKELGPFDGVIGFSQGAALAISYIYDRQTRLGRRPFQFGLLFSSACPFSPNPEYSRGVLEQVRARQCDLATMLEADDSATMTLDERAIVEPIVNIIIPLKKGAALLPDIDMNVYHSGDIEVAPRLLLSQLMSEKIAIPTVHIHGKRDNVVMRDMSLMAREVCEKKVMKTLEHSGSHEPPQKDAEVRAAVRAMEWAIMQARRVGYFHL